MMSRCKMKWVVFCGVVLFGGIWLELVFYCIEDFVVGGVISECIVDVVYDVIYDCVDFGKDGCVDGGICCGIVLVFKCFVCYV